MIPLCKAKRIGNGEWVKGYVIYDQYTKECEIMRAIKKDAPDSLDRDTIWLWDKVRPETVCMWTGKEDANGVRIFEGDRVKVKIGLDDEEYTVFWHVEKCQFMLADNENVFAEFDDIPAEICEVIGSIHDQEGGEMSGLQGWGKTYPNGWVCPKCGTVMGPSMPTCCYCKPGEYYQSDQRVLTAAAADSLDRVNCKNT